MNLKNRLLGILLFTISINFVLAGFGYDATTDVEVDSTQVTVTVLNNGTDSNETTRFNNILGNCSANQQVFGFLDDGTKVCVSDATGATTNFFDQSLNTTDNVTFYFINITGQYIWNGTDRFSLVDLNATAAGITDTNCSDSSCAVVFYWANQSFLNETDLVLSINTTNNLQNILNGTGIYSTFNSTYDSNIDTNCSDSSCAVVLYWANESILNTNSSGFWDNLNTVNTTQMNNTNVTLTIKESWLETFFNSIFRNYFDQLLNISSSPTFASINISGSRLSNGTDVFSFEDLNNTIADTDTDTNASTECSNDEVLLGNASCQTSASFFDDTDTTIANETRRMINLTGTDCTGNDKVKGVDNDGNLICETDNNTGTAGNPFDQDLNTTQNVTFVLLNLTGDYLWNNDTRYSWSDLNNTGTDTTIGNCSGDGDCTTIVYYSNVSNLGVNQSEYWDNATSWNATQTSNVDGILTILESWLDTWFTSVFRNFFDQSLNKTDNVTFYTVNLTGNLIHNGSDTFSLQDLNNTGSFTDTNCSQGNCGTVFYFANQSLLNETDLAKSINTTENLQNILNGTNIYSTYNSTYDTHTQFVTTNLAWDNETNVFANNQNFSENITVLRTNYVCLNVNCTQWLMANTSGVFIQG